MTCLAYKNKHMNECIYFLMYLHIIPLIIHFRHSAYVVVAVVLYIHT